MKDYLVCIDSDGCAMDTMTIKHVKCFGPCIIEEFNLFEFKDEILKKWNDINLYSIQRGINRFKGLYEIFKYINKKFKKIDEFEIYEKWINTTKIFSNNALLEYIKDNNYQILHKVVNWSNLVNENINKLKDDEKIAFEKVFETLKYISNYADIAIVSSANRQAMEEEWIRCNLFNFVSYSYAQDIGDKKYCLNLLKQKGYKNIIMVGDAKGDLQAANSNDISFYPICVNNESNSWLEFKQCVFDKFVNDAYSKDIEQKYVDKFIANLSKGDNND